MIRGSEGTYAVETAVDAADPVLKPAEDVIEWFNSSTCCLETGLTFFLFYFSSPPSSSPPNIFLLGWL